MEKCNQCGRKVEMVIHDANCKYCPYCGTRYFTTPPKSKKTVKEAVVREPEEAVEEPREALVDLVPEEGEVPAQDVGDFTDFFTEEEPPKKRGKRKKGEETAVEPEKEE